MENKKRKEEAIDILWEQGWTYEMIGEALSISVRTVMKLKHKED